MCVCLCVSVCLFRVFVHVWLILKALLNCSPLYFLRQGLSLPLKLTDSAAKSQGASSLHLASAGIVSVCECKHEKMPVHYV